MPRGMCGLPGSHSWRVAEQEAQVGGTRTSVPWQRCCGLCAVFCFLTGLEWRRFVGGDAGGGPEPELAVGSGKLWPQVCCVCQVPSLSLSSPCLRP